MRAAAIVMLLSVTACDDHTLGEAGLPADAGGMCGSNFGTGFRVGEVAQNWALQTDAGTRAELYDFCGKVVFFEEGSQW